MPEFVKILKEHCSPLQPVPTEASASLQAISGIRAALFDIYGTMLVSGSGDVGTVATAPGSAVEAAFAHLGVRLQTTGESLAGLLIETIQASHARASEQGVEYPEIDIVEIWRETVAAAQDRGWLATDVPLSDYERLALEYEVCANPVWTMPGLADCLKRLVAQQLHLGIISNAQFFSLPIFPAITGATVVEIGFDPKLLFLSYQYGQAKPGDFLFDLARDSLSRRGISPGEVIYIGNDMLNDILPAQRAGFRTALFAGDARSLRLRDGDDRVKAIRPDIIVTTLSELADCLSD